MYFEPFILKSVSLFLMIRMIWNYSQCVSITGYAILRFYFQRYALTLMNKLVYDYALDSCITPFDTFCMEKQDFFSYKASRNLKKSSKIHCHIILAVVQVFAVDLLYYTVGYSSRGNYRVGKCHSEASCFPTFLQWNKISTSCFHLFLLSSEFIHELLLIGEWEPKLMEELVYDECRTLYYA